MQTKNILVVTEHLSNNGAERVLSLLINEWLKLNNHVSIVLIRPDPNLEHYSLPENIELLSLPIRERTIYGKILSCFDLYKVLKNRPNYTILAFVNLAILVVGLNSFFISNKIIFSERNDPTRTPANSRLKRLIRDLIFNVADKCVFQTEMAKLHFSKKVQRKSEIISNPINPILPSPYMGARRKVIVTACRLEPQKNLQMLIKAFARFSNNHPDYYLEIFGRGREKENLIKLTKQLSVEDKVLFKDFASNLYEKIKDASMYVLSSDFEGISNSMLEALALGLPTIATDCPVGGSRSVIKNNVNGILIPVGDVEALYSAMIKVVDNPEFAQTLSESAKQVRKDYCIKKIAKQWLEIL